MKRVAGFAHSKHRSKFGIVVAEGARHSLRVGAARQWDRDSMGRIAPEVAELHGRVGWDQTYADQMAGEHLLEGIRAAGVPVSAFNYKKALDDPAEIERTVVMDRIEQVQFLLLVKQQDWMRVAGKAAGPDMATLRAQISTFSEHTTEAGSVDYYAPGEEHDHLIRALLAASFALRNVINGESGGTVIMALDRQMETDEEYLYE